MKRCDVDTLAVVLRRLSGTRKGIVIPHGFDPPASLEGSACVYILIIHGETARDGDRVYVGETESIRQRLVEHTAARQGTRVTAVVTSAPNKSSARGTESLIIARLRADGYHLEGGSDGSHILFSK